MCVCVCEDLGKGAWEGIPVFLGVKFLPVGINRESIGQEGCGSLSPSQKGKHKRGKSNTICANSPGGSKA